jgi:hypothetical protein
MGHRDEDRDEGEPDRLGTRREKAVICPDT